MSEYTGPERRCTPQPLTEEQIERIAEIAADRAVQKMADEAYKAIGKGVVERLLWLVGAVSAAVYLYGTKEGWWK